MALFVLGLSLVACSKSKKAAPKDESAPSPSAAKGAVEEAKSEKPSAKEAAKIVSALPEKDLVDSVVNPKNLPPYAGPTGTVRGVVKATGDKPPELPDVVAKMEPNCDISRNMFGVLFREGKERELADVLVAVTRYDGYVPAKGIDVEVWAKGCSWDSRTIAITYGQRLEIHGADNRPYVPELLGQPLPAQLFVLPTAPPVQLPPQKPGRYQLVDSMRLFNVAELLVLPYATMDVTGVDGSFEIKGVPAGEVRIDALLPQTGATSGKTITVEADKVTEVSLELAFNRAAYDKLPKPTPLDELPAPDAQAP